MHTLIETSWHTALTSTVTSTAFNTLLHRVSAAYDAETVFPPQAEIFSALTHCPLGKVRVVILGQDPYHQIGQAHGLAFSVPDGITIPPSLRNMYTEIEDDIGTIPPHSGNLTRLADQGVLLLNTCLTVAAGQPLAHQGWGWEKFTDAVIRTVSIECDHVVFLLWGVQAASKRPLVDETKHLVLVAPHPSPLSAYRGFFGCKHFSQTNTYLVGRGHTPITW